MKYEITKNKELLAALQIARSNSQHIVEKCAKEINGLLLNEFPDLKEFKVNYLTWEITEISPEKE
jgi:hypothetical protein